MITCLKERRLSRVSFYARGVTARIHLLEKLVLSAYRVLDLTTERGLLCGQILGDLGADVIKVEPPGGSPARKLAPFFEDQPDPNRSLYWWAYNRNKGSITLNLETDEGRELLYRLAQRSRFLIESHNP